MVCDFAETYGVFNYKALPARTAAVLAAGLGVDSRIQRKLSNSKLPVNTALLALILDSLNHLTWMLATNSDEIPHPASIYDALTGAERKPAGAVEGFATGEDFMKEWGQ